MTCDIISLCHKQYNFNEKVCCHNKTRQNYFAKTETKTLTQFYLCNNLLRLNDAWI